jgi:23S rRNA (uracil1939-C5)-methyltransferase
MPASLGQVEREATLAADWLRPAVDARAPFLAVHAGAGLHALLVARALGAPAILLEESAAAVDDARAAIEAAGLPVEARAVAPVAELARLADARRGTVTPFGALLVQVPARGLAAEAFAPLAALLAPGGRAAFLAEDPERLAAALGALRLLGLRTARVVPLDAEPGTDRVHAVALVERTERAWEPPRLYEDEACIVLAKPGGIVSTGADSLDALLLAAAGGERRLWPAHRLDAGTSGAILFARTKEAARTLGDAFAASEVERHYVVLAAGHTGAAGTIETPLPEPGEPDKILPAVTRWKRRQTVGAYTLLDVQVETGRTHQIRRHLAAAHHPVVGDGRYGDPAANRAAAARAALERPFVHAALLGFRSPATGAQVTVEAPLPADLAYALARLG